jgi:hypothetical protein
MMNRQIYRVLREEKNLTAMPFEELINIKFHIVQVLGGKMGAGRGHNFSAPPKVIAVFLSARAKTFWQ